MEIGEMDETMAWGPVAQAEVPGLEPGGFQPDSIRREGRRSRQQRGEDELAAAEARDLHW